MSDDEESDEEDIPRCVLATLRTLGDRVPAAIAKPYGDRPIWFILEMDSELVTLFERIPEDPMPKGQVTAILEVLRAFAVEKNEALQAVLGVTDGIEVGFHVDAPYARVVDSFEKDGFAVVATIEAGTIVVTEAPEEASEPL